MQRTTFAAFKLLFSSREKSIYGKDAEQAAELAIKLVKDLLSGRQLVGESGNPVILEEAY